MNLCEEIGLNELYVLFTCRKIAWLFVTERNTMRMSSMIKSPNNSL